MQKGDLVKCREFSYEPLDPIGPYSKTWGRIGIIVEYDPKSYMAVVVMQQSGQKKKIASRDLQLLSRTNENHSNLMKLSKLKELDMQVYCDMDGVLVDFEGSIIDRINETLAKTHLPEYLKKNTEKIKKELNRDKITLKDLKEGIGTPINNLIRELMHDLVEDDEEWWANLPWLEEGKKLWEVLSRMDKFPIMLTTPMDQRGKKGSLRGKERWVRDNLKLHTNIVSEVRVVFSHNKYEYTKDRYGNKTILIDDYHKNIKKFNNHNGCGILYNNDAREALEKLEEISDGTRLGNYRILAEDT